MNTRQPIQPSSTSLVLSVAISSSRNRITAGLSTGLLVFRSANCLPSYTAAITNPHPDGPFTDRIAVAEALDDRYLAFVPTGRGGKSGAEGKGRAVVFWDCVLEKEVQSFNFWEEVKGVRVTAKWLSVVLHDRTVLFGFRELVQAPTHPSVDDDRTDDGLSEKSNSTATAEPESLFGPNKVHALHPTFPNPHALACLHNTLLVLPAQSIGQVQLIPLPSGSKRVLRAHNTPLRCLGLSPDGTVLATASEQGTLIRIFDTKTLAQLAEFRRGVDKAIIYSLAFSDGGRWLACTSDKGTVHVFDLRPPPPASETTAAVQRHTHLQRKPSNTYNRHATAAAPPSIATSATPTHSTIQQYGPGSIQEYYTLRPPPIAVPPVGSNEPTFASAMSTFKNSSWAPKVLKDVRSVANHDFHSGEESPHWQTPGGAGHVWTTRPDGTRKRVANPVLSLPGDPSGRPPKGIVAFAPRESGSGDGTNADDDRGAVLYIVGGGTNARWECFDLVPRDGGGWALVRRGWRAYMSRQFLD